jgi:murein DD-endopeptidase MepM/ murein hydrolase activator NlpD
MRWLWLAILIVAGGVAGALFTRFEGSPPMIETRTEKAFVGKEYAHEFMVKDEGLGVEQVRVWLDAGGKQHVLLDERYEGNLLTGATLKAPRRIEVRIVPRDLGLADGVAALHLEALDYSWRGNRAEIEVPLQIDTKPPRIGLRSGLTYVRRGGAELAIYTLDDEVERHGVQLGARFFPGYPHPTDPSLALAIYAYPWETPLGEKPSLVAVDKAGNQAQVSLPVEVIERTFPMDRIALSDNFLQRKVAELSNGEGGELLASYLAINRDMRKENDATIAEVTAKSSPDRLWEGPFQQLPNSKVFAEFAEQRTYEYQGQIVDRQVHLGFDFASNANSPALAANHGIVVFAGPLGIYGNTVILDHGLGLFSLYGHLSEVAVEKGQTVGKAEALGRTGETGLAGGDHLHYSMLVSGAFVDPREWFDGRWIEEHVLAKLQLGQQPQEAPEGPA